MVAYADGSVLAQLATLTCARPSRYGMAYPERIDSGVNPLDLTVAGRAAF